MYELHYFNSVALSDKNVPLPVSDTEEILYFSENLYFRFLARGHQNAVESAVGTIYLTTHRIIYVPVDAPFSTFFVPLTKIFGTKNDEYIECLCENNYVGFIYLNFRDWQNKAFYNLLEKQIENLTVDVDSEFIGHGNDAFYSDLVHDE